MEAGKQRRRLLLRLGGAAVLSGVLGVLTATQFAADGWQFAALASAGGGDYGFLNLHS